MIPAAWVALRQMPLTPNGKVDRRALPAPQSRPEELGEYVAPRTELERILTELWAQLLRVDQVGVEDDFFELGGHSLLATQVVVRIQSQLSIDVPVKAVFECPTVEKLAARVEELREARLLDELRGGEIEGLLESVAAMSESSAQQLLRELSMEGRP
jgi:acyl carrier protein